MHLNTIPDHRRVLLLQGPIGPFFRRLARFLTRRGTEVFKINFNGGDALFFPGFAARNVFHFRDRTQNWKQQLQAILIENRIEAILLFGDCRFYHRVAIQVARRLGVEIYVFEEGYIRPDFFTLEYGGANGHSSLPRDRSFYDKRVPAGEAQTIQPVGTRIIWPTVFYAVLYGIAGAAGKAVFPYYRHHRKHFSIKHGLLWIRGWLRKPLYALRERKLLPRLSGPLSKKFFLVPLQIQSDSQLLVHSKYRHVNKFIQHVMASFSTDAPADRHLVFKHHPLDRGFRDYGTLVREAARAYGVEDRVHYVHDLHLPTLLRHALGTVVVNSTVGFSSLLHQTPVKTLGKAIYGLPGLVHQGSLASFWRKPEPIDQQLHRNFRRYLIAHTQINGSLYSWRGFRKGRELEPGDTSKAMAPAGPVYSLAEQCITIPAERTNTSWEQPAPHRQFTASNSSLRRTTTRV